MKGNSLGKVFAFIGSWVGGGGGRGKERGPRSEGEFFREGLF